MDLKDKTEIIARYQARLAEFGHDVRTLASGTDKKQMARWQALIEVGIRNGGSILDVGCGFADILGYMTRCGIDVDYTGYDIVPGLIDVARQKNPGANFELRDIQETPPAPGSFDWVISSQAFNNKLRYDDNLVLICDVLKTAFASCRKGVAVDMMGDYVDFKEDHLYYFSPEKIFGFAKSLSPFVTLRNDYLPYEFSVYIYREAFSRLQERV